MLAAFLLQEKRLDPVQPRARLTPRQYVRDFVDHPMLLKLGFVNMLRSFGLADVLIGIGHKTLCTDYFIQGMIGQQSTTMNIFYGVGRTLGLILVGATINYVFDNDYSVIWPISGILAVVGILVLLGVRDVRYEDEKRLRLAAAGG